MKSPKPPDPFQTASAQSSADISSAMAQQIMNRTNQVTPYGNLTFEKTGSTTYNDPLLNKNVTLPTYTATTSLTPEQQGLLAQEQQFDKMYNDIALAQTQRIGGHLSEPFKYDVGEYEGWAG